MKPVETGLKGTAETVADAEKLAVNVGSGTLPVFSTPSMAALMEQAAGDSLEPYMTGSETTVGTEMNIRHISATPEGMRVRAESELTAVNGREFVFAVRAYDECGLIGEGIHKRFIVNGLSFTERAQSKSK